MVTVIMTTVKIKLIPSALAPPFVSSPLSARSHTTSESLLEPVVIHRTKVRAGHFFLYKACIGANIYFCIENRYC